MWKPGQLVTIGGKIYRVTKSPRNGFIGPCTYCIGLYWVALCDITHFDMKMCAEKLPQNCHLRRINLKK